MLRDSGKYTTRREGAVGPHPSRTYTMAARSPDPMALVGGSLLRHADDLKMAIPHARIRAAGEVRLMNRFFCTTA
jgi:hypothetical protein